jgi:FkbH-like protein
MEVHIRFDNAADVARVAQLHQKTNQFNLNPLRLTEADISDIVDQDSAHFISVSYADRFGDAGIIGTASFNVGSDTGIHIETFMLSCRVLGLGIDDAMLRAIVDSFGEGTETLMLSYQKTDRNAPGMEFLDKIGTISSEQCIVEVAIGDVPPCPEWISTSEP